MDKRYQYVSLINMLPKVEALFQSSLPPLSRIRLDTLLKNLDEQDAKDIAILVSTIEWFNQKLDYSDEAFIGTVKKQLDKVANENIQEWIRWRLSFRTLIVALRLKKEKRSFLRSGFCHYESLIERHWHEPAFGLEKQLPWLAEAEHLLDNENALQLEKLILNQVWQWLEKISLGHEFDLEAVAIYRMRWDLVNRWTSYKEEEAAPRLTQLLENATQKLDMQLDWSI